MEILQERVYKQQEAYLACGQKAVQCIVNGYSATDINITLPAKFELDKYIECVIYFDKPSKVKLKNSGINLKVVTTL